MKTRGGPDSRKKCSWMGRFPPDTATIIVPGGPSAIVVSTCLVFECASFACVFSGR